VLSENIRRFFSAQSLQNISNKPHVKLPVVGYINWVGVPQRMGLTNFAPYPHRLWRHSCLVLSINCVVQLEQSPTQANELNEWSFTVTPGLHGILLNHGQLYLYFFINVMFRVNMFRFGVVYVRFIRRSIPYVSFICGPVSGLQLK
jgi:hypothetical protein